MKLLWIFYAFVFFCIYIFTVVYLAYKLLWFPIEDNGNGDVKVKYPVKFPDTESHSSNSKASNQRKTSQRPFSIEIWGKASIGMYLWKHILNGDVQDIQAGFVQTGVKRIDDMAFTFRAGPGIIPTTVPISVKYLILVLNGRSQDKVDNSKMWLDYLPMYKMLQATIVILLGDEQCRNNWLLPYMKSRGGLVNAAFIVYDSPLVDNVEFYQWPLGVSVYRGFPNINPDHVDLTSSRSYLCNFVGTIYKNSSREILSNILKNKVDKKLCYLLGRKKWITKETEDSLNNYMNSLLDSDLTLNPVGMNSESYRIYESLSLGSIPVLENVVTPGKCDRNLLTSPFRLLKLYKAPVIYINDWNELPDLLMREREKSEEEVTQRRIAVTEWYKYFKKAMKDKFLSVVKAKFFPKLHRILS